MTKPDKRQPHREPMGDQLVRYTFKKEETLEHGRRLARLGSDAGALEEEKASVAASYKGRLDMLYSEQANIARLINDGFEMRPTPCDLVHDFQAGMVRVIRTDTDEVVSEREMKLHERQMPLRPTNEAKGAEGAPPA